MQFQEVPVTPRQSELWRANPLVLDIHSGSFLTTSFHRMENFLEIKSLALCSLMKLISALIHNKAFILLFGWGLTTLITGFFSMAASN